MLFARLKVIYNHLGISDEWHGRCRLNFIWRRFNCDDDTERRTPSGAQAITVAGVSVLDPGIVLVDLSDSTTVMLSVKHLLSLDPEKLKLLGDKEER